MYLTVKYFRFCPKWNERVTCVLILAGIHHLILDNNYLVLKRELFIGERMTKFWKKYSSEKDYIPPTFNKEEIILSFTEWLKMQPLKDYKHFIRLLNKTKQERLAAQLDTSCKLILTMVTCVSTLKITIIHIIICFYIT